MLKITLNESPGEHGSRFILAGSITGPWVDELQRLCDRVLADGGVLILDFSQVSFLDGRGIALCRSLLDRRVALVGYSRFVAEQMKEIE